MILFFPVLPHKDKMNRAHSTPWKSKQASKQTNKNNKKQILYEAPGLIFSPPPFLQTFFSLYHHNILNSMLYKALIATEGEGTSLPAAFVSKTQESQEFGVNLDYV